MAITFLLLLIFFQFKRVNNLENNAQLIRFLQPDDVDSIHFNIDDMKRRSSLCTRNCETNSKPMLCYYQFTLEQYTVMGPACYDCPLNISNCYQPQCVTADGIEKMILVANRRMPGPSIQVCQGDTVVVDVVNKMAGRSTAVHWHGLKQRGTPFMDGMPGVTQCPILSDQTFRYKFKTANSGTFFWHSHDGTQKMDGLVGNLIVRGRMDANREQYDLDLASHVVLVTDWMHETSDDHQPGLLRSNIGQEPDAYLVNGRGVYLPDLASMLKMSSAASGVSLQLSMPLARFVVKRGLRYRFRVIGGSCLSCPFRIYFQSHQLTLINMDMNSVRPVTVDAADISSGERFDFVINANQAVSSYWIYITGLGACKNSRGVAVLQYEGALLSKPLTPMPGITSIPNGAVFNRRNSVCRPNTKLDVCVTQLRSQRRNPEKLVQPPDARILVNFIFYQFNRKTLFEEGDYKRYFAPYNPFTNQIVLLTSVVKNVSNSMPSTPLLSQIDDISDSKFCSDECLTRVNTTPCDCLLLVKVPLGAVVEILFVDDSEISEIAISHPFHMHGYEFYIMETGVFTAGNRQTQVASLMERLESQSYSRSDYPSKDTIDVPAYGYAVTRIVADNPGFWFVHCHFIYHLITGMSLVIQVGETSDMPVVPRGFPTCDDFLSPDASLL
uniref:Multicopper oxidase 5 n=1 Tax=Nilaparvata lugens TaxID=108931 RepID=A0A0H3YJV8_NILLU|nr:multicopper oxidase 5 [Nilaparvata lugens]